MCSQALSTGPVLPPLFASVLTESRSGHPTGRVRIFANITPSQTPMIYIFSFILSVCTFFSPRDAEKRPDVVYACCFLISSGFFLLQKKRKEKMTKSSSSSSSTTITEHPISSVLTALLCCSSRQTISCATSPPYRLGNRLFLFFFLSFFYPSKIYKNMERQLCNNQVSLIRYDVF